MRIFTCLIIASVLLSGTNPAWLTLGGTTGIEGVRTGPGTQPADIVISSRERSRGIIIVDDDGGGDHQSIQAAVDAASPGDTIHVWAGTYGGNVVIDRNLTLAGNGSADTFIDGGGAGDVLTVRSGWLKLSGFTIMNGGSLHAGIDMNAPDGSVVEDCRIRDSRYGIYGGNIGCHNNTIANNTFRDNTKAGIWLGGDDNLIVNNSLEGNGHGMSVAGSRNEVRDNACGKNGAGLLLGNLEHRVLQMGNSYTASNNMAALTEDLLRNTIPVTDADSLTGGGMTLDDHADNAETSGHQWNTTLNGGTKWDWVLLQDQSQVPGFPTSDPYWQASLAGAKVLDRMTEDAGGETVLLMTWGRRDGDSMNPGRYPNFTAMQGHLENGYRWYAENISTTERPAYVAPAGLAWKHIHDAIEAGGEDPTTPGTLFYNLYVSDGSHPSLAGSYLTACVIYATVTGMTPVGLKDGTSLNSTYRQLLQEAAAATVFNETADYVYPWQTSREVQFATDNTVTGNTFFENTGPAIIVSEAGSQGNVIHHNELLSNNGGGVQAVDDGWGNAWDDGSEGNYWSDYTARYPGATNDSVVWNIPYALPGNGSGADNYPLVDPFGNVDLVPPTPNAGADMTVDEGTYVTFDGTGSSDDFGIVNYSWTFTYNATPLALYGAFPGFLFDIPGNYTVNLTVIDAAGNFASDNMTVTVLEVILPDITPPVPPAGLHLNRTVEKGTNVLMDAGTWSDGESEITGYNWTFIYDGSVMILDGNLVEFTFDIVSNYTVALRVQNSANLTGEAWFWIDAVTDDISPVADAGDDITVSLHTKVTFNGSGSHDNRAVTNHTWTFEDDGKVTIFGASPSYVFDNVGTFKVALQVWDALGNWDNDTLTVSVIDVTPPVAVAGDDVTIVQGYFVNFNGSLSHDNIGIVDARWVFDDPDIPMLTGHFPIYRFWDIGVFNITLNVTDAAGNYGTDDIVVTVQDGIRPTAVATASEYNVAVGTTVTLNGSESYDNVGIEDYVWFIDHNTSLSDYPPMHGVLVEFNFTRPGSYIITLTVHDAMSNFGMTHFEMIVEVEETPMPPAIEDDGEEVENKEGMSPLALAGVIVAVSIVLLVVIILTIVLLRRKKKGESGEWPAEGEVKEDISKGMGPEGAGEEKVVETEGGLTGDEQHELAGTEILMGQEDVGAPDVPEEPPNETPVGEKNDPV